MLSKFSYGQSFNLNVTRYQQSCTKEITRSMDDPQTRWYLSSTEAVLFFASKNDPTSGNPQLTLKVLKTEWDKEKDYYTYTVYDAKRDKYGIIVYFRPSNYLSLQYTGQTCSLDFEFYR